ncbi:hypothetical protein [Bartonella australis]|uniref:hypothetical protein n=1 Tax=Bartonella australis TaxID=388640 RepID=UPI00034676D7|nr:hypothetical protein [Bartonella australis]
MEFKKDFPVLQIVILRPQNARKSFTVPVKAVATSLIVMSTVAEEEERPPFGFVAKSEITTKAKNKKNTVLIKKRTMGG